MLYRRYSDPMALLTGMLRRGKLADFIQQCVRMYNEETEEKLLWEVWLHSWNLLDGFTPPGEGRKTT